MRRLAGQAARHTGRTLHLLTEAALAVIVLLAVAGGLLAWRLSQGPIDLSWLAPPLERAVNADRTDLRVRIHSAALAWEGFRNGVDRPLDVRLTGLSISGADGTQLLYIPSAGVSLSLHRLLLGQIVPRGIELDGARLALRRAGDGAITLDLGQPPDATATQSADTASSDAAPPTAKPPIKRADFAEILRALSHAATTDVSGGLGRWDQLRRVDIRDAALSMDDKQLGLVWRVPRLDIDLNRAHAGGVTARVDATLPLGGQTAQITLSGAAESGGTTALHATISPLIPATLATLAPPFAPLAPLDAPVGLIVSTILAPDLMPLSLRAEASIGAGTAHVAAGTMPIVSALIQGEVNGALSDATLTLVRFETAPRPNGPRTTLKGTIRLRRDPAAPLAAAPLAAAPLHAAITADLDQASFADLPALWPVGLGGPGSRPWITKNITDGMAHNGHVAVDLTVPADFSDATVTAMSGGMDGHDLTVHWLRPVAPIEHAEAHLTFTDPDTIDIAVQSGRLAGPKPGIAARNGLVHLTGIAAHEQYADIDVDLTAPLPDVVALLKQPKIGLLDRRPVPMNDPSGQLAGRLGVTKLPLRDAVSMDDVQIHTSLRGTDIHIGAIAAGRDLDHGAFDLKANNDGLSVRGKADVARIPTQLAVDLDFRAGPPRQVLQKIDASSRLTEKDFTTLGVPVGGVVSGASDLKMTLQTHRDGRGDLSVAADLTSAELVIPQLSWRKPEGDDATVQIQARLDHDRIAGIDRITAEGKGIDIAATAEFADGKARTIRFERVVLGDSINAGGELGLPSRDGDAWRVQLRGTRLDVSSLFTHHSDQPSHAGHDETGPAWSADVRIDRIVLGPKREMATVVATAESNGQSIGRARLTGHTSAEAPFQLEIAPQAGGRSLSGSAADAGGLLRALDVMDEMEGGSLTLSGVYDDRREDHRLTGTANIDNFRIRNAPALAKLLQAMTLYGLVDVVRGPGLGFTHLIAPFSLAGDTLELTEARAFSPSLGMTAKGHVDLARRFADVTGTIVPAYFFNSLLGRIPLIGRIFSPETGGGVFAADYSVRGPLSDPTVGVNPLAAITPGFLRGMFKIFD